MKNKKLYLFLGGLFVLLVLFFAFFYKPEKSVNWSENYQEVNKDPYGLHIARQLVAASQPNGQWKHITGTLAKGLPEKTKLPANYVFMGASPYFDSSDVTRLLTFVRNGNTAFLATKNLPKSLRDSLIKIYAEPQTVEDYVVDEEQEEDPEINPETQAILDSISAAETQAAAEPSIFSADENTDETDMPIDDAPKVYYNSELFTEAHHDSVAKFNFSHGALKAKTPFRYVFKEQHQNKSYEWYGMDMSVFSGANKADGVAVLGTMNDTMPCFIKVRYGKGFFLLHASPILFTNYFLLNRQAVDYLQNTLNYLPEGDTYWDEPSKTYRDLNDSKEWHPEVGMGYKGPFDYLLSQPALRWAFYLMWALAVIYLVFGAKRRQRSIPVFEEKTNSSIEFADNLGRLYYLQNDHKKLAEQKMKVFLHTLREKYNLPTHLPFEELISRIIEKVGVPESIVRPIFTQNEFINYSGTISQEDLIEFHNYLEQFYHATKK